MMCPPPRLDRSYTGRLKINLPPTVKVYVRQTRILTRKNWLVGIRNRRAVAVQLLVPFIFLGLLYGLQFALSNNARLSEAISVRRHSQAERISAIPRCIVGPGGGPCFTFGYTPSGDPLLDAIMEDGTCVCVCVSVCVCVRGGGVVVVGACCTVAAQCTLPSSSTSNTNATLAPCDLRSSHCQRHTGL